VSGDKNLLKVGQYRGIKIVPPAEFVDIQAQQERGRYPRCHLKHQNPHPDSSIFRHFSTNQLSIPDPETGFGARPLAAGLAQKRGETYLDDEGALTGRCP
jgi:hypothetical protein